MINIPTSSNNVYKRKWNETEICNMARLIDKIWWRESVQRKNEVKNEKNKKQRMGWHKNEVKDEARTEIDEREGRERRRVSNTPELASRGSKF